MHTMDDIKILTALLYFLPVKIPEIEEALEIVNDKLEKMENNEQIWCSQPTDGVCTEGERACTEAEKKEQEEKKDILDDALKGWGRNLALKPETSSIKQWYNEAPEAIGDNPLSLEEANGRIKIENFRAALVPEQLTATAKN